MTKVVFDISMSVDGFITNAAGVPEGLHDWVTEPDGRSSASRPDTWRPDSFGAIIARRRTYDHSCRPGAWSDHRCAGAYP